MTCSLALNGSIPNLTVYIGGSLSRQEPNRTWLEMLYIGSNSVTGHLHTTQDRQIDRWKDDTFFYLNKIKTKLKLKLFQIT